MSKHSIQHRRRGIRALIATTAMLASIGIAAAVPAEATVVGVGVRLVSDGCPGTVLARPAFGTARIGFYRDPILSESFFRTSLSIHGYALATYGVDLIWQDAAAPQGCQFLPIGTFRTTLLGAGTFGTLTSEKAFHRAFGASLTGSFNIWVEAIPAGRTGTLVTAPVACSGRFLSTDVDACPAY